MARAIRSLPTPLSPVNSTVARVGPTRSIAAKISCIASGRHNLLRPLYAKLIFAVGFYERQLKRLTPELERDCREYILGAYAQASHSKKTTQLRTVPVNKTIAIDRKSTRLNSSHLVIS